MANDLSPIVCSEHSLAGGYVLAQAELSVAATLNSLSLEMTRLLTAALDGWATREDVAAVLITGSGEKAFCAGGDIQALYHAIGANHAAGSIVDDYPFRFFEEEYRLDYQLHTYPKPVVCSGHGIVMGGGLGIFSASRFRVITERSRLAVPEITIGLFPDAGASWTLRNMPGHFASFLGLSGSHANAADALLAGMGTHTVAHDARHAVGVQLQQLPLTADATRNAELIEESLGELAPVSLPESELSAVPERAVLVEDFEAEIAATLALEGTSAWIDRGLSNLRNGCPTTAGIVVEQLRRVPHMTLADTFRMELTVGTHCATNTDFREGVRALLIDKDNQPAWKFGSLVDLEWSHVLSHFEAPWPDHPLADLG